MSVYGSGGGGGFRQDLPPSGGEEELDDDRQLLEAGGGGANPPGAFARWRDNMGQRFVGWRSRTGDSIKTNSAAAGAGINQWSKEPFNSQVKLSRRAFLAWLGVGGTVLAGGAYDAGTMAGAPRASSASAPPAGGGGGSTGPAASAAPVGSTAPSASSAAATSAQDGKPAEVIYSPLKGLDIDNYQFTLLETLLLERKKVESVKGRLLIGHAHNMGRVEEPAAWQSGDARSSIKMFLDAGIIAKGQPEGATYENWLQYREGKLTLKAGEARKLLERDYEIENAAAKQAYINLIPENDANYNERSDHLDDLFKDRGLGAALTLPKFIGSAEAIESINKGVVEVFNRWKANNTSRNPLMDLQNYNTWGDAFMDAQYKPSDSTITEADLMQPHFGSKLLVGLSGTASIKVVEDDDRTTPAPAYSITWINAKNTRLGSNSPLMKDVKNSGFVRNPLTRAEPGVHVTERPDGPTELG